MEEDLIELILNSENYFNLFLQKTNLKNVGPILKSLPMNQIFSGEKSGGDFDLILMPTN